MTYDDNDIPPWARRPLDDELLSALEHSRPPSRHGWMLGVVILGAVLFGVLTGEWATVAMVGLPLSVIFGAYIGARWARVSDRVENDIRYLRSLPPTTRPRD